MFTNTIFRRLIFTLVFLIISVFLISVIFYPLYVSDDVTINLLSFSFNICDEYASLWNLIKILYLVFFILSNLIYSNMLYPIFFNKKYNKASELKKKTTEDLHLKVFNNSTETPLIIPKDGLYQNILITGTIRYWKN